MRGEWLRVFGSGLVAGCCLLAAMTATAGAEADTRYRQAVMKAKGSHMIAIQAVVKGDVPHAAISSRMPRRLRHRAK